MILGLLYPDLFWDISSVRAFSHVGGVALSNLSNQGQSEYAQNKVVAGNEKIKRKIRIASLDKDFILGFKVTSLDRNCVSG